MDAKNAAERIIKKPGRYWDEEDVGHNEDAKAVARAYLSADSLFKAELADACKEYEKEFARAEKAEARVKELEAKLADKVDPKFGEAPFRAQMERAERAESRIQAFRETLGEVIGGCKNFKCGKDWPCGSCQLAQQALAADDAAARPAQFPGCPFPSGDHTEECRRDATAFLAEFFDDEAVKKP